MFSTRMKRSLWLLLPLSLWACATNKRERPAAKTPPADAASTADAAAAMQAAPGTAGEPASPSTATSTGAGERLTISRPRLLAVLEKGIPAFLSTVDVDPVVKAGHFQGWRWKSWRQPVAPEGISPGDLLVSANGHSLERPEAFTKIWLGLRQARAIDLEVVRPAGPKTLHYEIIP